MLIPRDGMTSSLLMKPGKCKSIWMQDHRIHGPSTLYPPTTVQFDALIRLLQADTEAFANMPCPLPIHATPDNRPRWDTLVAFTDHHIFRHRYDREPRPPYISEEMETPNWCRRGPSMIDWPECEDEWTLMLQDQAKHRGEEIDEEVRARATEGLRNITPSSPLWERYGDDLNAE